MSARIQVMRLVGLFGFFVANVAAGAATTEGPLQEGDNLPLIEAESLAGERVELPRALQDRVAIVMITFSKDGGEAAAAWVRAIDERFTDEAAPDIWQVLVLEEVPSLIRGFVVGGIKRGIPDAMHSRSLALYEDGAAWSRRCSIESDDTPCVMLLGAGGHILWLRTATVTDVLLDDLEETVLAHADEVPVDVDSTAV